MTSRTIVRVACLLGTMLILGVGAKAGAQTTYDPIQAGEDAFQAGESQRRAAIDQQHQLNEQLPLQNAPTLGDMNARGFAAGPYGYVYNPRRAYRQGLRYGYPPLFQSWPLVPGNIYGYPYYGYLRGPTGFERTWANPNGFAYRPGYEQARPQVPTPATPQPPAPAVAPPSVSEPIPAPPSEPGPKEF